MSVIRWTNTAHEGLENAHAEISALKQKIYYQKIGKKKGQKILVLSDLHIPFHNIDLIKDIIREHKDADILVINGDFIDQYSVSTFVKDKYVALYSEYMMAIDLLKWLSRFFKIVYLVKGNHEVRLNRWFNQRINPDIGWLFSREILGRLANGDIYDELGNVIENAGYTNVEYVGGEEPWWLKIGRTIFCHPLTYSRVSMRTSVMAAELFFNNLVDFDCLVTAHTHQTGSIIWRGKKLIEQGALCHKLDYEKQGKLTYMPHYLGYAVVYQDKNGNADFNKSRVNYVGMVVEDK